MTKEHSTLTGASLHEPKGVGSATSGQVYVANGIGSGSWTTITNPFSTGLLHVRDEKSSGTGAQTLTASTWNIRNLNTVKTNEIVGAAVSSNQITGLTSGVYYFEAYSSYANTAAASVNANRIKLYNVTTAADILVGPNQNVGAEDSLSPYFSCYPIVRGRFTLTGTSTIELRHYTSTAGPGGLAATTGGVEVYSDIVIWKLT